MKMQHKKTIKIRPLIIIINIFFFYIILCCFFSLILFSLNGRIGTVDDNTRIFTTKGSTESYLPICEDGLLDKRNYHFEILATRYFKTDRMLFSKTKHTTSCRLLQYTVKRAVNCIDFLLQKILTQQTKRTSKLNFVFIGDSRTRQQFYNFLKLIPNYDRETEPLQIPKLWTPFHGDVDVDSNILNLRVSFKWRPIINETVVEMIHHWSISDQSNRPQLVFLGLEVYHMMEQYGDDLPFYIKRLKELSRILDRLGNVSQVIWLNQYPAVEFYGSTNAYNTKIHSQKIYHYNEAAQAILRNYNNIRIWDSSNSLAEEYVRACSVFSERENPIPQFVKLGPDQFINSKPYINCLDYIHTGYAALSQATQLLFNDICNRS